MKHLFLLLCVAFMFTACSSSDEPQAEKAIEPCDCVETYRTGDAAAKSACDDLRKTETFDTEFRRCLAAAITGRDADQVNFINEGELKVEMPQENTFTFSAEKSTLTWTGKKIGTSHTGQIALKSGYISFASGQLVGCEVVLDMTQITNTDLQVATEREKLLGHLNSDEFFGVAKHPESRFVMTSATMNGPQGSVRGQLTIKGITNEIEIKSAVISKSGPAGVVISGVLIFDRAQFDVRYGSDKFFDNLGDAVINDEVTLNFKLRGTAQPA